MAMRPPVPVPTLSRRAKLVLGAIAVLLVLFTYRPLVENIRLSFYNWNISSPRARYIGLNNYVEWATRPDSWKVLGITLVFTVATVPARFAERGDLHAEIDDVAHDLTPLLEMYERDEQGDMPYPPDYPKMPGEPPRVQPSRKNALNWENA